jgi:hypothetical protein
MIAVNRTEAKPRRRISKKYRKHVDEIARIYVECEEVGDCAAREVRNSIPELSAIYGGIFSRWRGVTQWEAALKAPREKAAVDRDLAGERRSRSMLRWGVDSLDALMAAHEQAVREDRMADADRFRACIIRLNEALRAEEKHVNAHREQKRNEKPTTFTMIYEGCEEGTVPREDA